MYGAIVDSHYKENPLSWQIIIIIINKHKSIKLNNKPFIIQPNNNIDDNNNN